MPSLSGTVLKKKWKLGALVGKGGCAEVYEAIDARVSEDAAAACQFVAKVAPIPIGLPPAMKKGKKRKKTEEEKHADMIYYEYTLYKGFLLQHGGVVEIPTGGYGEDKNLRFLIMTRLGPDVEAAQEKGEGWTLARKAGYARQMLALLRTLHETCKMVFVDVKPENFMFGLPGSKDEEKIFLIDFGLSSRYTGPAGAIKPQSQSAQIQGTPEFLSLKCHAGASPGRCDDLESLGYVIVSMLKEGSTALPWSGSTSVAGGLAVKRSTTLEELCRDCPAGMLEYMRAVRGMKYEEAPAYDKLDAMLKSMQNAGAAAAGGAGTRERGERAASKSKQKVAAAGKGKAASAAKTAADEMSCATRVTVSDDEDDEEVQLCDAKVKGKGRAAKGQTGSARAAAAGSASATTAKAKAKAKAKMKAADKVKMLPPPESPKQQQTTTVLRRSRRLSSPIGGEQFFDALEEHDSNKGEGGDAEVEVTKVLRSGASRRVGAGAAMTGRSAAIKRKRTPPEVEAKQETAFVVEVVAGPHSGQTLRLNAGGAVVSVGRNAPKKNGLRLDKDLEVSEKHANLRPQADGISVEDVKSLNGSFVNEDRLERAMVLRAGDVLQVGNSVMKISCCTAHAPLR